MTRFADPKEYEEAIAFLENFKKSDDLMSMKFYLQTDMYEINRLLDTVGLNHVDSKILLSYVDFRKKAE